MDDFNLRDMLMPPLRYQSDLSAPRQTINRCPEIPADHPPVPGLAMAYVPAQRWEQLYEPEQGFHRGTIFRQLDLPFEGGAAR